MSIYSNVSEEDLINLRRLAEQQKNQRALKIKNRILKQTHDIKLAESLSPITKNLDEVNKSTQESLSPINKKLDTINESTQKVGDIIKESNFENEIIPSILLQDTLESLENTTNSLKLNKDEDDNYSILKSVIKPLDFEHSRKKSDANCISLGQQPRRDFDFLSPALNIFSKGLASP